MQDYPAGESVNSVHFIYVTCDIVIAIGCFANYEYNTSHTIDELDIPSVVDGYTEALLESGGMGWHEIENRYR